MCAPNIPVRLEILNKIATYYGLERAHPFADRDLIAFVMAIPGEIVLWKGVYKGLFREAMRGILPEVIRSRSWKADFTQLECDAAAALTSTSPDEYLGPHALAVSRGYIDSDSVSPALAPSLTMSNGPSFLQHKQLNELVSLEIWLQAFFAGGFPGVAKKL
jgi:asparagine synthase (glutamine-hydrolysing)